MKREIFESEGGTNYIGQLPLGCQLCMRGQKMVLFIGGKCDRPERCSWYCPISEERRGKDVLFADELPVESPKDVLQEAKLIKAMGCSITGGDPLATEDNLELTLFYIEELKNEMQDDFHIHLYTAGRNFTETMAEELADAGLDEIRFHPAEVDFHKIEYAMDLGMEVGAEVPVIPTVEGEEYVRNLIDYVDNIGGDFVNLNEFEMNDPNAKELIRRGFELEEDSIASVKGSKDLANKILNSLPERYTLSVHFCNIALKDGPQMRNRYRRRAESIHKPFEEVTEDGTLIFLRVEGKIKNIKSLYRELLNESGVPPTMMELNLEQKTKYLYLPWFLSEEQDFKDALLEYNLTCGIVEALPFRGKLFEICEYTPIDLKS